MSQLDLATLIKQAATRFGDDLAKTIMSQLSTLLTQQLQPGVTPVTMRRSRKSRPYVSKLTKWTADKKAKRVPLFVIEQTGLSTKQEIVEKYGDGAVFVRKDMDFAKRATGPIVRKAQHPADEINAAMRG